MKIKVLLFSMVVTAAALGSTGAMAGGNANASVRIGYSFTIHAQPRVVYRYHRPRVRVVHRNWRHYSRHQNRHPNRHANRHVTRCHQQRCVRLVNGHPR